MPTKFYFPTDENTGGTNGTETESIQSKFPEDPGTENHRIPDGGGPANGFIDEEGHNSGKGFLTHVDENDNKVEDKDTPTKE